MPKAPRDLDAEMQGTVASTLEVAWYRFKSARLIGADLAPRR